MSLYRGNTEALKPVYENGAWTVYDEFGPFDGPYDGNVDNVRIVDGKIYCCRTSE